MPEPKKKKKKKKIEEEEEEKEEEKKGIVFNVLGGVGWSSGKDLSPDFLLNESNF